MEEPQEMFLVHIDKEIIANVLKRVRNCEYQKKQINKSSIVVKYDKSHTIDNISGLNLKKEIEKFVPNDMNSYINQKNEILKSIGYDDKSMALNMQFQNTITNDDLINMSMGLKKSVPIVISDITQTRFNIELPFDMPELINSSDVTVSINNISDKKANMIIKRTEYSPILFECDFDVYIDTLQIIDNKRMTLKNSFLTIHIDFEKINHKLQLSNFENEECRKLEEWLNIFKFVNLSTDKNRVYYMEIKKNDRVLNSNSEFKLNLDNTDWHKLMYDIINKLSNLYRAIGLSNNIDIVLQDILNNYEQINSLYDLAFSELKDMKINFNTNFEKNDIDIKSALIFHSTIIMNNQYIIVVFILIGIINSKNGTCTFVVEERINSDALVRNNK